MNPTKSSRKRTSMPNNVFRKTLGPFAKYSLSTWPLKLALELNTMRRGVVFEVGFNTA